VFTARYKLNFEVWFSFILIFNVLKLSGCLSGSAIDLKSFYEDDKLQAYIPPDVTTETLHCAHTAYFCVPFSSSFPPPPPPPPQALKSVMNLGFQDNLPPFPTVSDHCLPAFYFHYI